MQSDTLVLQTVQLAIAAVGLDAIIIGNVAAALHGAPVTTLDIDYFIQDTRLNDEKLKRLAERLGVHISRPFEPASMVRQEPRPTFRTDTIWRWANPGKARPTAIVAQEDR